MGQGRQAELVSRLAAAVRGAALYTPTHPLVQRSVETLAGVCTRALRDSVKIAIGFLGDDLLVDETRLPRSGASHIGLVRNLRDRDVEKITIHRGVTRDELRTFVVALAARGHDIPLATRLERGGVKHIAIGRIEIEEAASEPTGLAAARKVYQSAVDTAESLWEQTKAGDKPDPAAARQAIESLAKLVSHDRTSMMALTTLKRYDNYTFTHMVNVSVLAMAQARSLNLKGPLLREFGFAALMHDIGKVNTPLEILNKPDKLTKEEFLIMKRHVVDGAHILRRTPEMPALAPVVAFEHHLKQDLTGYPEKVTPRKLNLCTMIVTIADVFDALRSTRVYREGLPNARVRAIMAQKDDPAFQPQLLRRFINLVGMFSIGTLVRLNTDELAVVSHAHPGDPFRPEVLVISDSQGNRLEDTALVITGERDSHGDYSRAVVEAVDHEPLGIDPLSYLQ